jgi:type II secretory pathway component PulF
MRWFKYEIHTEDGRTLNGLLKAKDEEAALKSLKKAYGDERNATVFVREATSMDGLLGE